MPDLAPSSQRPGVFISVEGIDGAGKSTHVPLMAALLQAQGWTVCQTREPGGTPLAERLRELVLHEPMDALTEALLVFAARREHITRRIAPALARGEAVLSDRFTDATFAYQGGGRGFDWATLALLESAVQGGSDPRVATDPAPSPGAASALLQPDLTLWFDLDPAVAAERLAQARTPDRFEALSADFFRRVREGYLQRAQAMPDRFVRIDASGRAEEVAERVDNAMQRFLSHWTTQGDHV